MGDFNYRDQYRVRDNETNWDAYWRRITNRENPSWYIYILGNLVNVVSFFLWIVAFLIVLEKIYRGIRDSFNGSKEEKKKEKGEKSWDTNYREYPGVDEMIEKSMRAHAKTYFPESAKSEEKENPDLRKRKRKNHVSR